MRNGYKKELIVLSVKKSRAIAAALMLGMLFTGCGSDGGAQVKGGQNKNAVEAVIDQQIAAEEASKTEAPKTEEPVTEAQVTEKPTTEAVTEEQTTEAVIYVPANAVAADEYDPFEGIDQEYVSDPDPSVDYDLTAMSSEMVYATVLQMLNVPDDYIGKKIKMSGVYYTTYYDVTDQYYHYVIIKDATACCAQGMEFVWGDGNHVFPDEYPPEESEVEVIGEFEAYQDPGDPQTYVHLKDSSMNVLKEAEESSTELKFEY